MARRKELERKTGWKLMSKISLKWRCNELVQSGRSLGCTRVRPTGTPVTLVATCPPSLSVSENIRIGCKYTSICITARPRQQLIRYANNCGRMRVVIWQLCESHYKIESGAIMGRWSLWK